MYPTRQQSPPSPPPRVLVVGAGALGCAALRTLAADGGVAVTLVDDDRVELSNLQRQVLYLDDDIGRLKVDAAADRLLAGTATALCLETAAVRFDATSGPDLVAATDLVIDATDDPATKFLIGRLCAGAGVASVYAGVARTGGQWMLVVPGRSACLECVFPAPRARDAQHAETAAGCGALGILAPVAGLVGAMQAITALAFLEAEGSVAAGRLHLYELTGARSRHVDFPRDAGCEVCRTAGPWRRHRSPSRAQTFSPPGGGRTTNETRSASALAQEPTS